MFDSGSTMLYVGPPSVTDSSNVGTNIKPWVSPAQGQVVNQVVKLRQQATIDRQLLTMVIIQSVRTSFFPSISLSLSLCVI